MATSEPGIDLNRRESRFGNGGANNDQDYRLAVIGNRNQNRLVDESVPDIFTKMAKRGVINFTYDTWDSRVYSCAVHQEASGLYRMFYTAYGAGDPVNDYGPATATSTDFVNWTKPIVGEILYPTVAGNTNNNLIIFRDNDTPTPLELGDVIWDGTQYVALAQNKVNSISQLYTSPDGEVWTFGKNAFQGADLNGGAYAEPKCILYDGSSYKLFYRSDDGGAAQRRSLGYYESATLLGTYVDQGFISNMVSSDQTVQFYDIFVWPYGGKWLASVIMFNKTTEKLGPHMLYESEDTGETWSLVGEIIDTGAAEEFDSGLIAAGKPILVSGSKDEWQMIYVGSTGLHNVWPRPMQFATAIR